MTDTNNLMVPQDQPEGETARALETIPADTSTVETATEADKPAEGQEPNEGEGEGADKPRKTPWFEKRISKQSAKIAEMARENERLRAALALPLTSPDQEDGSTPPPARIPPLTPDNPAVIAAARQLAADEAFTAESNKAYDAGVKAYPDFDSALSMLGSTEGFGREAIEAAIATGAAEKVLYALGKDPETAERVFALPPVKMAVELARIADRVAKPRPVSNAPAPVKPVNSSTTKPGAPDIEGSEDATALIRHWQAQSTRR